MHEALVTPRMLSWARERLGLTPEAVAEKANVRPEKVLAWEAGEKPSIKQAFSLAGTLCVPIGYLYLEKPPTQESPIPDLRTVSGRRPTALSVNFTELLNDVLRKQEWYRDHLLEEGAEEVPLEDGETLVAASFRHMARFNQTTGERETLIEDESGAVLGEPWDVAVVLTPEPSFLLQPAALVIVMLCARRSRKGLSGGSHSGQFL